MPVTNKPDLISELLRIPPAWSNDHARDLRSVLLETGSTRPELLAVVGTVSKPLEVAGWRIFHDAVPDRIRFQRAKPMPPKTKAASPVSSRPAAAAATPGDVPTTVKPVRAAVASVPRPEPPLIDPLVIARAAVEHQHRLKVLGLPAISTSEAVDFVLRERGLR